ncbi:MAG: NAD-dependent epimerase/dehydratase family protein [Candidatus Rokuibacteriota bacterium]
MMVLVTGGTGFVGSHTVAAVKSAGHEAKLFVRNPARIGPALEPHELSTRDFEHAVGDVNDVASVRRALEGCDAVIHAGSAYAYNLPFWKARALMKTNVEGTANVLRAARDMRLDPIVYVSTSWAIVQSTPTVLTEDSPIGHPPDAYPRSKARAEGIARQMQEEGAPVVITYPPGVWGPHDPYWGETAQLAEMILRGRLPFIPDGTGPFCDVRDVARLHAAVLEPAKGPGAISSRLTVHGSAMSSGSWPRPPAGTSRRSAYRTARPCGRLARCSGPRPSPRSGCPSPTPDRGT